MLRLIVLVLLAIGVYSFWKWTMNRFNRMRDGIQRGPVQKEEKKPKGDISELVQDPICKLFIAKEKAISYKGEYFCSEKCKSEFH